MADPPPPPNQRPPNDSDDPRESVDALAAHLRKVVKVGLAGITAQPPRALFVLESVRRQAEKAGYPDTDDGLANGLRDVVKTALDALGPGADGDATRLLFGAVADSAGRNLGQRRTLAANHYDIVASTFRQGYEPRLVREVAVQVFRIEHQAPDLQVITNPDPDRREPSGEAAPLHVVIDTPGTALALHATAPTDAPQGRRLRGPRRLEWVLLALISTGLLWWQWGPRGVLRGLAAALIAGLTATIAGAVRGRDEAGGIGHSLLAQAPRLAWLGLAVALSVGGILADANPDPTSARRDPCAGITPDPQCAPTTTAGPDEPSQAELSPNYVPTTLAPVPAERSPEECPPEGNKQRRLSWVHGPPLWCIDPEARYEATVHTNFGEFKILLNTERSAVAVNNFYYLAGWHFYDGVTLEPSPKPLIDATGMRTTDPVAPDDTDKVPGYGLTFDHNTYPDLPVSDDERVYVVVTDSYKASRWAVIVTDDGANKVELEAERWPLIGQVSCGVDVIANDSGTHDLIPAYTSAPIVIDHITIRPLGARETPELHPRENCE